MKVAHRKKVAKNLGDYLQQEKHGLEKLHKNEIKERNSNLTKERSLVKAVSLANSEIKKLFNELLVAFEEEYREATGQDLPRSRRLILENLAYSGVLTTSIRRLE